MTLSDEKILELNGWTLVCESPFEIEHNETTAFASGLAAELVIGSLRAQEEQREIILDYLRKEIEIWEERS